MTDEHSELDEVLDEVYDWVCDFVESDYFGRLGPEHQDVAEDILLTFTEFMYSYHGLLPEEWDEPGLEECCLYTIAGKVVSDEVYFRSIAPVLSLFFRFAGEEGLLRNGPALAQCVRRIGLRIVDNAFNPRFWGPAKTFGMAAVEAGVDLTNEQEMNRFMVVYNQWLTQSYERHEPVRRSQPKVGRNDPCPCGSGKKYKKCCGK